METGDLFGMYRRYRVVTRPHFLTVYPQVLPLRHYQIASRRPIGDIVLTHRLYEDPTRIIGIRKHEAGDPLNRVHWRATTRTGILHSKIYEPSVVAGATLVIDFHRTSHPSQHEPVRSELAVTAAATLANAIFELRQQVGLVTNARDAADHIRLEGWAGDLRTRDAARESATMLADSVRLRPLTVPTRRRTDQFMRIRETLARMELTDGLPLTELLWEAADQMPRDASAIVITPVVDRPISISLGNLKRQGYAVTVLVNTYDETDYGDASGPLFAQGVTSVHLKDEESVVTIAEAYLAGHLAEMASAGSGLRPSEF